jgi:hypothetical protein
VGNELRTETPAAGVGVPPPPPTARIPAGQFTPTLMKPMVVDFVVVTMV